MKVESKFGYKGRIIGILFLGFTLLMIRETVKMHFGQVPHLFPIPALIPLCIVWFLGKQYDKTVYLSTKDTLTGLFNRRYVLDNFAKERKFVSKRNIKLAVLLIDVNDFKEINDHFGHDWGDRVLEGISKLLQDSFGQKDIIARWGGDEFLVLSKFRDEKELLDKIGRFEDQLNRKDWQMSDGLSVSIGKALFPLEAKTLNDLLNQADANMYELKMSYKQKVR